MSLLPLVQAKKIKTFAASGWKCLPAAQGLRGKLPWPILQCSRPPADGALVSGTASARGSSQAHWKERNLIILQETTGGALVSFRKLFCMFSSASTLFKFTVFLFLLNTFLLFSHDRLLLLHVVGLWQSSSTKARQRHFFWRASGLSVLNSRSDKASTPRGKSGETTNGRVANGQVTNSAAWTNLRTTHRVVKVSLDLFIGKATLCESVKFFWRLHQVPLVSLVDTKKTRLDDTHLDGGLAPFPKRNHLELKPSQTIVMKGVKEEMEPPPRQAA